MAGSLYDSYGNLLGTELGEFGQILIQGNKRWASASTGKVVYKDKASVKNLTSTNVGAKTLYAKWTLNTYKITYNLNGGTNSSNPTSYKITSNTII